MERDSVPGEVSQFYQFWRATVHAAGQSEHPEFGRGLSERVEEVMSGEF
jgi:hypothetical protein